MSSIEANIATQVADNSRPVQVMQNRDLQTQQARVSSMQLAATDETDEPITADNVRAAAARMQQVVEASSGQILEFSVDDDTKQLTMQVKDAKTGKVIRQVPPKEVLDMEKRIHELVGLLVDKQA